MINRLRYRYLMLCIYINRCVYDIILLNMNDLMGFSTNSDKKY